MISPAQFAAGFLIGFMVCYIPIKPRFTALPTEETDPDVLLAQAQNEMREAQAKNRERAVQAITEKNSLQALVNQTQIIIDSLHHKAEVAERGGDAEWAQSLLKEAAAHETNQASIRASLERANAAADQVKVEIRLEEERIRALTAKALAMKAQWKHTQIAQSIEDGLLHELQRVESGTDLWDRVQMRIDAAEAMRQETRKSVEAKFDLITEKLAAEEQKAIQAGNEKRIAAIRAEQEALRQMFSV